MKKIIAAAALAAVMGPLAMPAATFAQTSGQAVKYSITVSCYRGPWQDVIWDKPNPEFISSLTNAGYSAARAEQIGIRICRDASLVGNLAGMRAAMRQVLRNTPPS